MLDAVLELIPTARVGHIGLQRDEMTAIASQYYSKLPADLEPELRADDRPDAGDRRKRRCRRSTCSARAGATQHPASSASSRRPKGSRSSSGIIPDVHIYTPVVDSGLNEHKFIVPGLGDFGDRLYGTT